MSHSLWNSLRSLATMVIGNMSIQASLRRFRSSENLPIHLTISMSPLLARKKWIKSQEANTLSYFFFEIGSQRTPEILDSIFCSQRFSIEKSFVHFSISDKSVLQCWVLVFLLFKHCKIQSSISSSYLNQEVGHEKRGGIFIVIPFAAVH